MLAVAALLTAMVTTSCISALVVGVVVIRILLGWILVALFWYLLVH